MPLRKEVVQTGGDPLQKEQGVLCNILEDRCCQLVSHTFQNARLSVSVGCCLYLDLIKLVFI